MTYRSGIGALDNALSTGEGCPPGLLEIYGGESSGKTGLALWFCREALNQGLPVAWISTEQHLTHLNLRWAGITPSERLIVGQQDLNYSGVVLALAALQYGARVVVIDSFSSLLGTEGEQPLFQVLSWGLPLLRGAAREQEALVIGTNQIRRAPRGPLYSTGSGPALQKLIDTRIHLEVGEGLYRSGEQVGARIRFSLPKNGKDLKSWGREGRFNLYWQGGLQDLRNRKKEDD